MRYSSSFGYLGFGLRLGGLVFGVAVRVAIHVERLCEAFGTGVLRFWGQAFGAYHVGT